MGKDSEGYSDSKVDVLGSRLRQAEEKIKKLQEIVREQQLQISNDAIERINDERDLDIWGLNVLKDNLELENKQLKSIIQDIMPFARRYADGRSTFAPSMVNEAIDLAISLGVQFYKSEDPMYAEDGMFGKWNPKLKKFEKE